MSKRKKASRSIAPPALRPVELTFVRFLFLLAFGISLYLAINSWRGGGVPGCGPESDCDKVLSSRWAYIFGLPISFLALPIYLAGLVSLFQKTLPWRFLNAIAITILIMAAWFVGLQMFALRAFCKFCMTAHLAGATAAIILLRRQPLPARFSFAPMAAAAAAAILVITAQIITRPPAPVQVSTGNSGGSNTSLSSPTDNSLALSTGAANPTNIPPAQSAPTFTILEGQVTLDLTKVPVTGRLDAEHKLVKLFDYTCHHCRDLHHLLEPFRQRFSNELAIVSLPVPLDANCNPVMKSTPRAHQNACDYARLALAVFLAAPERFEQYSNWLFAPPRPPELTVAREHAARLVTQEKLTAALTDPRIAQQLKQDSDIFVASSRLARKGTLPQMIFARTVSVGGVSDGQQLNKILSDALGLGANTNSAQR